MARRTRWHLATIAVGALLPAALAAQVDSAVRARNDSVWVRLIEVDVRAAVQALAPYLDRPIVLGGGIPASRVTVETPHPLPRADVVRLLRGVLAGQNLELVSDTAAGAYRVAGRDADRVLAPGVPSGAAPGGFRPPSMNGQVELFVIRLRHARAADVAATVSALYGRASALGELGGRAPTLAGELRQNQVPSQGGAPPGQASGAAGRGSSFTGETTIVPDPGTNSLLIRANRGDYELMRVAVEQLDVRPLQVLIEVLIAEVRRDRGFSFGVEVNTPATAVKEWKGVTASASQKGIGLGDFVLKVMREGVGVDFDATLRAAADRGDARIVSRPVVLAANNETAEILVGSQRPFVQVSRSLPTDAPSRDQVVQYKDVGTKLTVRPTVSADGYVALEVTQEVNAATMETQFDAPVISTRTVQTRLIVRDSQTVVLGGLSDQQREASQGGIPVLSSIPILGGFFGRASRRTTETEFFLFLTPRVIRSDADADAVTEPYGRNANVPLRSTPEPFVPNSENSP